MTEAEEIKKLINEAGHREYEIKQLQGENALARLCPRREKLASAIRVLDVAESFPGHSMKLVMDGELQEALCFLEPVRQSRTGF